MTLSDLSWLASSQAVQLLTWLIIFQVRADSALSGQTRSSSPLPRMTYESDAAGHAKDLALQAQAGVVATVCAEFYSFSSPTNSVITLQCPM